MSRITDTERGARKAVGIAQSMLNAHYRPDLFPQRLTRVRLKFWKGIHAAALEQVQECEQSREAMRA